MPNAILTDGNGLEKKVYNTVYKGQVQCKNHQHWFLEEHDERLREENNNISATACALV